MTLKTIHEDNAGDTMVIYIGRSDAVFIDGKFNNLSPEFGRTARRGIFDAKTAREIANRLNDTADAMENSTNS
ncbi:hypothetical protein KMB89_gp02 [Citrobacter phage HCF1]|uniref:Uncharacterized protein n=1 Tax=Citrobacter phage HCF1 TaxID=2849700 RepID=A0ABX6D727_9CAUD|nr:hypothetical protein KMB89_gp02 [Citrobacter phage HCF1]